VVGLKVEMFKNHVLTHKYAVVHGYLESARIFLLLRPMFLVDIQQNRCVSSLVRSIDKGNMHVPGTILRMRLRPFGHKLVTPLVYTRDPAGLRGGFAHIVRVARLALLLKRKVNLPLRSCTSKTFAVQGSAVLLSRLLSTTVMYMPRCMMESLISISLPGEPGVSRSSSSQVDSPSAMVDSSSESSSESMSRSRESLRHVDEGAGESEISELCPFEVRVSDNRRALSAAPICSDASDRGDVGD
jgi:hypothetical protein